MSECVVLKEAAEHYKNLPHQQQAWDWLEDQLSDVVLKQFTARYRNQHSPSPSQVPPQALALIKRYEGLSLKPYRCPAGVWTIGYGMTRYGNGQPVKPEDPAISQGQAEQDLEALVREKYLAVLAKSVPYWSEMNGNQQAALLSFAYNLGAHFMSAATGFDTIQSNLKRKDWQAVPETLKLYRNRGSAFEEGLLKRRIDEGLLWQGKGLFARKC